MLNPFQLYPLHPWRRRQHDLGEFMGFEIGWTWAGILSFSFLSCLTEGDDMLSLRVIKALCLGVGTERYFRKVRLPSSLFPHVFQLTSGWASLYKQSEKQLLVLISSPGRKTNSPVGRGFSVSSWPGNPWSVKLPLRVLLNTRQTCWNVARGNSRTEGHFGYRCKGSWKGHYSRSLKSSSWGAGGVIFALQWESRKANWELEAATKTPY